MFAWTKTPDKQKAMESLAQAESQRLTIEMQLKELEKECQDAQCVIDNLGADAKPAATNAKPDTTSADAVQEGAKGAPKDQARANGVAASTVATDEDDKAAASTATLPESQEEAKSDGNEEEDVDVGFCSVDVDDILNNDDDLFEFLYFLEPMCTRRS